MNQTEANNSLEQNKATVLAYVEAFNKGDFEAIRKLCTPDIVIQGVLGKGGWDVVLPAWNDLHEAYGLQLNVTGLIAEGEFVAALYEESGTFKKPFRGTPPTGRSYTVVAMEWFRMRDGKIAQRWGARDSANISRQLGV